MSRIPEELIQQIAAANDIVEVIGGYFPLKRAGPTYKALCPFHQERTPSFSVNPTRQIFKCFGCGMGGSVFRFVMEYEHIDFGAAVRKLAERAGIRVEVEELSSEDRARVDLRRRLLSLHAEAASFFHSQLMRTPEAQRARDYLKGRGIGSAVAAGWNLGFAPEGWDHLIRWAQGRGFTKTELLASGLVSSKDPEDSRSDIYDRFRARVMFPICNDTGEVIAFSGRILEQDAKAAKYVNSPETMLFTKGAVLFGLHRSKKALIEKSCAIVCEGQLDLITAFEAGVQNVIAPQGTAFTPGQARILKRYVEEVILCFDSDAAGQKATERSLPALLNENLGIRVAVLPSGEDPDSLIRTRGAEAFSACMESAADFFDFQREKLSREAGFDTPRGRSSAARKLAEGLGWLKDPVLRDLHIQRQSALLGVGAQEFGDLVREAANRHKLQASREHARELPAPPHPGHVGTDSSAPPDSGSADAAPDAQPVLDATLKLLALAVLHSEEARQWILEEDWQRRLQNEPGGEVLECFLSSAHLLESPATAQTFLTTLPAGAEKLAASLLDERSPDHPLGIAHDCWVELERRQIRRRMESAKARQRSPHLSLEEAGVLHQEILDLQRRLSDTPRPFSPLR